MALTEEQARRTRQLRDRFPVAVRDRDIHWSADGQWYDVRSITHRRSELRKRAGK